MWLNPEQQTNNSTTFFGASAVSSWISFLPFREGTALLWSGEAWYDAISDTAVSANEWTYVTFTVNNGTVKVYIDGKESFSGENFPNVFRNKDGVFALGVNYWDAPYKGLIDELQIYSRALKSEEVLANYNMYDL